MGIIPKYLLSLSYIKMWGGVKKEVMHLQQKCKCRL